jgi:lysophospholipase L1-like esterase
MMRYKFAALVLCLGTLVLLEGCMQVKPASKWESDIQKFEKQDETNPWPKHPILFVGSSTIRMWKVKESFPGLPVLNRGFGGSEIHDVVIYFNRIVARYHPSTIVFYSGDNDLWAGKTPAQVERDMQQFIDLTRQKTPDAKLIVIAIKPSIARWRLIDQIRETNQQIRQMVESDPKGVFINVESQLLGENEKPRPELFRADGLHLNDKGYAILNDAVRPYLK